MSHSSTVEFLTTTRIGEKGQVTVPKQFREELGLDTGASFAVLRLGDGLVLIPQQERFEQLCHQISARLVKVGTRSKNVLATLADARKRVYQRHYDKRSTSHLRNK
jgi:AbrB family looped-hinge helix DNA binding protein